MEYTLENTEKMLKRLDEIETSQAEMIKRNKTFLGKEIF